MDEGGYVSNVQPIVIKFGTKFDVNKNWLVFGDFSPKGMEIVGGGVEILKNA